MNNTIIVYTAICSRCGSADIDSNMYYTQCNRCGFVEARLPDIPMSWANEK